MKKTVLFILLSFQCFSLFSQLDTTKMEEIHNLVEEMPVFPGGMNEWLVAKIRDIGYPKAEKEAGISGKCYVTFIIDNNGNVTDPSILKGVPGGAGYDALALQVVRAMPRWKPGTQNGKAVSVQYNLPINFNAEIRSSGEVRKRNKALAHYNKGVDFFSNNKKKKAINEFNKALRIIPNHISSLYYRGITLQQLNKLEEACKDWNKIKSLGKPDADELINKYCK